MPSDSLRTVLVACNVHPCVADNVPSVHSFLVLLMVTFQNKHFSLFFQNNYIALPCDIPMSLEGYDPEEPNAHTTVFTSLDFNNFAWKAAVVTESETGHDVSSKQCGIKPL